MIYNYFTSFSIVLFITFTLFFIKYPHRSFFYLRLIAVFIVGFLFTYLINVIFPQEGFLFDLSSFGALYVIWASLMCFVYKITPSQCIITCCAALALEQFTSAFRDLVLIQGGFSGLFDNYVLEKTLNIIVVYPWIYIPFFITYYKTYSGRYEKIDSLLSSKIIATVVIFFCLIINRFSKFDSNPPWYWTVARCLYSMVCSFLALHIYYGFQSQIANKEEIAVLKNILRSDQDHLNEWKEHYELLSIRLHDIKHIINTSTEKNEYLNLIASNVEKLELNIKTGNKVLDIILYEKSIICFNRHIDFLHIVSGKALEKMEEIDIYSLFANIIDNAINAVSVIPEEKRTINLNVKKSGDLTLISCQNYFDPNYHSNVVDNTSGYGLKSVKMIVDKYSGNLKIEKTDEIFKISIYLITK